MCNERAIPATSPATAPVVPPAAPTATAMTARTEPTLSSRHHLRDLARMLGAAVAVGVCASVIAVGGTLLIAQHNPAEAAATEEWIEHHGLMVLRSDAEAMMTDEAAHISDETSVSGDFSGWTPNPGSLFMGDGCGSGEIVATERDWYVTIERGVARVKVMQTFNLDLASEFDLPQTDQMAGRMPIWFHAALPATARLVSAQVDTNASSLAGTLVNANTDQDDVRAEGHDGMSVYLHQSTVRTNEHTGFTTGFLNLARPGESLVFIYEYEMAVSGALSLALERQPEFDTIAPVGAGRGARPSGMVWVEWRDGKPAALVDSPKSAAVERRRGQITGLSWNTASIAPGDEFNLAWK